MSFIEEFAKLRICLYLATRVLSESSKTCNFVSHTPVFTLLLSGSNDLWKLSLLLTNSSLILRLSDSHRGCLIKVKFVKIRSKKWKATLALFSDRARCFSQLKSALYENLIIKQISALASQRIA